MGTPCPPTLADAPTVLADFLAELAEHVQGFEGLRSDPRYPLQAAVTLGVVPSDQCFNALYRAWAVDISLHGIGLLMDQDLPAGMKLVLSLEPIVRRRCLLPIQVLYSRQILPAAWSVGATFPG